METTMVTCMICSRALKISSAKTFSDIDCPRCGAKYTARILIDFRHEEAAEKPRYKKLKGVNPDELAFYDIETTGLKNAADALTIAVWLDQKQFHTYVAGGDNTELKSLFDGGKRIVTFNGDRFDLPVTKLHLGIDEDREIPSKDIMETSRFCGFSGGLKSIADLLDVERPDAVKKMSGQEAIVLWNKYKASNSESPLNALIYYCAWDVYMTYLIYCELHGFAPDPAIRNELEKLAPPDPGAVPDDLAAKGVNEAIKGKHFIITGDFTTRNMSREGAKALVIQHGGKFTDSKPTMTLDYLVNLFPPEAKDTIKIKTVKDNIANGAATKIINEAEFFDLFLDKSAGDETTP